MYMLLSIHRDMFTLLEIRRAEFNKNLENPLRDGIMHLGGGVKYAWSKASGGNCIGLVSVPTSLKDDCKKGKCIELGSALTSLEGRCKKCLA